MNKLPTDKQVRDAYAIAQERYGELGVDTSQALETLAKIPLSLHCWQGDDVAGFENAGNELGAGLAVTGNYPGKARNADELRRDLDEAYNLLPGTHRLNLHAIYAETGGKKVERTELRPEHFSRWLDWAKANRHGLDYNPTLFAHPKAADGFTLASRDEGIRRFWIEHCIGSRKIGEYFGRELGTPCITNIWIPDGIKDTPADRKTPRLLLKQSLDSILADRLDPRWNLDAIEGKLFGIGSESYVVGSHEFYLGYAITHQLLLTMDTGHYHPTELVSDKLSAVLTFVDQVLLHISRGVRWDSDHIVIFSDELQAIAQEIVRGEYLSRVHIGLDYFDASVNRIAAWVIGARSVQRALLGALLEPTTELQRLEGATDYTARMVLLERIKLMPLGAVWDYFCSSHDIAIESDLMDEIRAYETREMSKRS